MTRIDDAFKTVNAATTAGDLFNGDKDKAQRKYRSLAKVLHPDHVPAAKQAEANAAMAKLTALWTAYTSGDADRTYASVTIATRKRVYVVGDLITQGDLAGLYRAEFSDGDTQSAVLKITRSPANNDLALNEAKVLAHLADHADPAGLPYFSQLLDSFTYRDTAKNSDHHVNALTPLTDDWYTLSQVKTAFPDGLDVRDALWMWRRLLIAIGHAHRAGVVHGAVVPEHVLINGPLHGLALVDWSYARIDDNGFAPLNAIVPHRRDVYPADVLAKEPPSSSTDIYMASKSIATLLNRETPKGFRAFLKGCTDARVEDAWEVMQELTDLSLEHFPRAFRPFAMPVAVGGN